MIMKYLYAIALIAASSNSLAESAAFGKWRVFGDANGSPPIALTSNDSDNAFGQVCADDSEACFWLILSPKTPCKKGDEAPIIANSSNGAVQLVTVCAGIFELSGTKYHQYLLSPFDDIESVVKKSSGILSFAIPVQAGSFTVMRFDLNGSTKAISFLDVLKQKFFNKVNSTSTKDINL